MSSEKDKQRLEYHRQYYQKNKLKASVTNKKYYEDHKKELNKTNMERYYKNRERYLEQKREKHLRDYPKAKLAALSYYGNGNPKCVCCGEYRIKFLTIDHKNNDGYLHRKDKSTVLIYYWLKRKNYPEGYQTLCFNCNSGRALNSGICPHEEELTVQNIAKRDVKDSLGVARGG